MFFHYFKWNSRGLGVSRRTAPTIRSYLQSFSRFGGTWGQKVHFSTFSGKLIFQCSRNGPQNPPFCPGSLQDTFIIYFSILHQHIFRKDFAKITNLENRQSGNLEIQKPRFTNRSPVKRLRELGDLHLRQSHLTFTHFPTRIQVSPAGA